MYIKDERQRFLKQVVSICVLRSKLSFRVNNVNSNLKRLIKDVLQENVSFNPVPSYRRMLTPLQLNTFLKNESKGEIAHCLIIPLDRLKLKLLT